MSSTQSTRRFQKQPPYLKNLAGSLLDLFALAAWGILLVKYWLSGQLSLLIHPNYFGLVVATGFALLMLAAWRMIQLFRQARQRTLEKALASGNQHNSLFPPGWSSALLLGTAILGLLITPQVFASQTAVQRGIGESAILTRSQPQSFSRVSAPEARSLIDWIRTLNVYPEPDAYTGQPVKVQGFVVQPPNLPSEYLLISRFVITCCAADAYPVGLPVKLKERKAYPADTWLEIKGQMITETLDEKRQLVIEADSLQKIPEPENPYYY